MLHNPSIGFSFVFEPQGIFFLPKKRRLYVEVAGFLVRNLGGMGWDGEKLGAKVMGWGGAGQRRRWS